MLLKKHMSLIQVLSLARKRSEMKKKKPNKEQEYRLALLRISTMGCTANGSRMKEDVIDWQNIGRMATSLAAETLAKKCRACGKPE